MRLSLAETVFVLLSYVVTVTICYQGVNQLQSEFDDYLSEDEEMPPFLLRSRRNSDDESEVVSDEHFKCKQHSRKSCCGKKNLFKHFADPEKTLGKLCYDEVSERLKQDSRGLDTQSLFSCDKYKMMKKLQYCVYECVGKKRKLLNSNGDINAGVMKNFLTSEIFKDDWQKLLAEKAIPKCLNEKYIEWPQNEPGIKCNPVAVQFQHCLWKEFELNCPQNEQKDSKKCNKLRGYLKQQYAGKRKP